MDDLYQEQTLTLQTQQCAGALRVLVVAPDENAQSSRSALAEQFRELSLLAAKNNHKGVRQIADRVGHCLTRDRELPAQMQELECSSLGLAAEWLSELARLHDNSLPEPRGLVDNLLYSFALLDHAAMAGSVDLTYPPADLFDADPAMISDVWNSYVRDIDPFSEDPGFGHLFELLQRTLNHIACLGVCFGSDPFARDPEVADTGSVDMFEKDPPLNP